MNERRNTDPTDMDKLMESTMKVSNIQEGAEGAELFINNITTVSGVDLSDDPKMREVANILMSSGYSLYDEEGSYKYSDVPNFIGGDVGKAKKLFIDSGWDLKTSEDLDDSDFFYFDTPTSRLFVGFEEDVIKVSLQDELEEAPPFVDDSTAAGSKGPERMGV